MKENQQNDKNQDTFLHDDFLIWVKLLPPTTKLRKDLLLLLNTVPCHQWKRESQDQTMEKNFPSKWTENYKCRNFITDLKKLKPSP